MVSTADWGFAVEVNPIMLCSILVVLGSVFIQADPGGDGQSELLEEWLVAHEASQGAVRMLDVQLQVFAPKRPTRENYAEWLRDPDLRQPLLFFKIHWLLDGKRERVVTEPQRDHHTDRGEPFQFLDIYRDGEKEFVLNNWDWDKAQAIDPVKQGSASGEIRQLQLTEFRTRDPAWLLLRLPRLNLEEPRLTLREFVSRFASQKCQLLNNGNCLIELTSDTRGQEAASTIQVELDRSVGAQITRLEVVFSEAPERMVWTASGFREFDGNVFIPTLAVQTNFSADAPEGLTMMRTTADVISVNTPLSTESFDFRFPEDLQVVDTSEGDENRRLFIWGADGQPKDQIRTVADIEKYERSSSAKSKRGVFLLVLVNSLILFGGIVSIWFWKRRRGRTK